MRRKAVEVNLPHGESCDTSMGTLNYDDEFSVHGEYGRFRFRYLWKPDQSIVAFGPYTQNGGPKQDAMRRAFRPNQVKKIYRKKVVRNGGS